MPALHLSTELILLAEANLPMAASVFTRLSYQMSNIQTTLEEVAETVQLDPVLAVRVVRVANSPVYRRGDSVASLNTAIANIGTQQTCQIVGALVASRLFSDDMPHYGLKNDALWNVSITSAVAARLLAERTGGDEGESYTLALMRGVGRLLLQRVASDAGLPINEAAYQSAPAINTWECDSFGFDSAEATLRVLRLWNFPPSTMAILRRLKRRPFSGPEEAILHLGNTIADRLGAGLEIERGCWKLEPAALKAAYLEPEVFEEICGETRKEVTKIRASLE